MSKWEKRVMFRPGYDHRDEPDGKRGAHDMTVTFVLIGPLGAVSFDLGTGWVKRPLTGAYIPGRKQDRRDKPGVDARLWEYSPSARAVMSHTHERINEYDLEASKCPYIGGDCYGNVGYLIGDRVLDALFDDGEKGVWRELKSIYHDWTTPDT